MKPSSGDRKKQARGDARVPPAHSPREQRKATRKAGQGRAAEASDFRDPGLLPALGASVRAARAARDMSRRALAERAGLSARFVAQLESGRGNISVGRLSGIAAALELPLASLLRENGGPPAGAAAEERSALASEILALLAGETTERLRGLLAQLRQPRPSGGTSGRNHAGPPPIALVGLRGAGKSTIGPPLAEALGLTFLELDDRIQDLTGLALEEIFELHGERYYRLAEGRALQELVDSGQPAVVAVSGGIVTDPHSFYLLKEHTLLVWLKAPPELHMERVRSQGDGRPMRHRPNAMTELKQLVNSRSTLYAQARLSIDTSRKGPEDAAAALAREIGKMGPWNPPAPPGGSVAAPSFPALKAGE